MSDLGAQPAFPCSGTEGVNPESLGMSTRTWLAGLAMQTIIGDTDLKMTLLKSLKLTTDQELAGHLATISVRHADALIAELEKKEAQS